MKNDLLKQALTPAYVFSADELLGRIRMMQAFLGSGVRLVYAVKANPFLIRTLRDAADGFEVCSPGEVRLCIRSGIPPEKLIISGVNKELVKHIRCLFQETMPLSDSVCHHDQ